MWTETQGDGDRRQQRGRGAGRIVGGGCAKASGEEGDGAPLSPRPGRRGPELHDTALGLVRVWVLEPQSLLRPVFFQVGKLFAVDGSTPLPGQTEQGWGSGGTRLGRLPCPRASRHQSPVGLERALVASRARPTSRSLPGLLLLPGSPFPHHLRSPLLAFDSPGYHLLQAGSLTTPLQGPRVYLGTTSRPGPGTPEAAGLEPGHPGWLGGGAEEGEVDLRCPGVRAPRAAHRALREVMCPHLPVTSDVATDLLWPRKRERGRSKPVLL